jgi:hypothetical protein
MLKATASTLSLTLTTRGLVQGPSVGSDLANGRILFLLKIPRRDLGEERAALARKEPARNQTMTWIGAKISSSQLAQARSTLAFLAVYHIDVAYGTVNGVRWAFNCFSIS